MKWIPDNWQEIFIPQLPILEIVLRGTLLYLFIILLMRVLPRRAAGDVSVMDIIFVILISEGASNAMGDYSSLADGALMILTLMFWNFAVNYLSFHFKFMERFFRHPSVQIVKNGEMLLRNMRKEYITKDELMDHLRTEQIEDIKEVKAAYVEGEGKISVIKFKK